MGKVSTSNGEPIRLLLAVLLLAGTLLLTLDASGFPGGQTVFATEIESKAHLGEGELPGVEEESVERFYLSAIPHGDCLPGLQFLRRLNFEDLRMKPLEQTGWLPPPRGPPLS